MDRFDKKFAEASLDGGSKKFLEASSDGGTKKFAEAISDGKMKCSPIPAILLNKLSLSKNLPQVRKQQQTEKLV
jgi:hypothetical protein